MYLMVNSQSKAKYAHYTDWKPIALFGRNQFGSSLSAQELSSLDSHLPLPLAVRMDLSIILYTEWLPTVVSSSCKQFTANVWEISFHFLIASILHWMTFQVN